jgi:hypothetical protein
VTESILSPVSRSCNLASKRKEKRTKEQRTKKIIKCPREATEKETKFFFCPKHTKFDSFRRPPSKAKTEEKDKGKKTKDQCRLLG